MAGSILGREEQMLELEKLIERARLVTLTGAPGIGKSRLALAVAARAGESFAGGARVVELSSVASPAGVARAAASALGVQEVAGQRLRSALVARLGERPVLLVLDDCEHLLGPCARLVEALLAGCRGLRVLATSREALAVEAETVWQVPPLAAPDRGEVSPEAVAEYAAVALFVERARAVQPSFALSAYVAPAVAEICRRLDGIPLAIELAAARVRALTPQEIARRLGDRFNLLTRHAGNDLARHHTVEGALDWSHGLLSDGERALLRRLSVFSGGFGLEAGETVCAGDLVAPAEVGQLLARLAAKSLVVADGGSASESRCRLLETIRAYAGARLEESEETATLRARHAHYFLALAERAEPQITGIDQREWLARLEAERANLRAALDWLLCHGEAEQALRLAGALVLFWRVHCHFGEGRELLEAAVAAGGATATTPYARSLWGLGFMRVMSGDVNGAIAPLERSLACFRELGDRRGCARALLVLGSCRQYSDAAGALSLLRESADLAREMGDSWCLAHALGVAGNLHNARHELSGARPLFEQCLLVARNAGDRQGVRWGLLGLGETALGQGDFGLAKSALDEALTITGELGDVYGKASALQHLGQLASACGNHGSARVALETAVALYRDIQQPMGEADALARLAEALHAAGDRRGAHRLFAEALTKVRILGFTHAPTLLGLARIAAEGGKPEAARRMFGEVLELGRACAKEGATADALHGLAEVARSQGDLKRAAVLHDEALELAQGTGSVPAMAASLEAIGGLAAAGGRCEHAAQLLGAASSLREQGGYARPAWESSRYQADLALLHAALPAEEFDAAYAKGVELSLEEALGKASRGRRGQRGRPVSGWASLTEREHEIVALVAEGLSNPQIAERLFISRDTVKTHLSHVLGKLGFATRAEVAAEHRQQGK